MLIVGPVPDINEILLPIGEAVRGLLDRVSEGEATTKLIIVELTRVIQMIDEAGRP
jgi:hypothetical protein